MDLGVLWEILEMFKVVVSQRECQKETKTNDMEEVMWYLNCPTNSSVALYVVCVDLVLSQEGLVVLLMRMSLGVSMSSRHRQSRQNKTRIGKCHWCKIWVRNSATLTICSGKPHMNAQGCYFEIKPSVTT